MLNFAGFINVLEVFADGADIDGKKLGHQLLRQPHRFVRVTGFDTLLTGLSREDQELGGAVADQFLLAIHRLSGVESCRSLRSSKQALRRADTAQLQLGRSCRVPPERRLRGHKKARNQSGL